MFLPIRAKRKRRSLLVKLASWRTPSIICSTASSKSTTCQLTTIERSELVQETTDTRPSLRRTRKFVNANLFETVFNLRMDLVISVWSLFAVSSCEEPDAVDTQDIESHHLPHQRFPLAIRTSEAVSVIARISVVFNSSRRKLHKGGRPSIFIKNTVQKSLTFQYCLRSQSHLAVFVDSFRQQTHRKCASPPSELTM